MREHASLEPPPHSLSGNGEDCARDGANSMQPRPLPGGGRRSFVFVRVELRPAALKETPHGVSRRSHLRRVLVEQLAVVEDELSVRRELLAAPVPAARKEEDNVNGRNGTRQTDILTFF